ARSWRRASSRASGDEVARLVDQHRDDDDRSDHDKLPERVDVEHDEPGREHGDDEGPDPRADHGSGAAEHADPADDDRGDPAEQQRTAWSPRTQRQPPP